MMTRLRSYVVREMSTTTRDPSSSEITVTTGSSCLTS
jgi:hypothetical protein